MELVRIFHQQCKVINAAVSIAYDGARKIDWLEIYAGEKAANLYGQDQYLPEETIDALKKYIISIKGPLATPVGGGIRSLNVAMRQKLDLYVCLRPVQYFQGVPSPLKNPEKTDMVIFRENTEDIYAGIEYSKGTKEAQEILNLLEQFNDKNKVRFPETSSIGIKPVSEEGTKRLTRKAIQYAIDHNRKSVTFVHKGNIMKFTEVVSKQWSYDVAIEEFGAKENSSGELMIHDSIIIKDCIADAFLQEILLRPERYDVVATLNLNGDYVSDALAAQVGGIGISPEQTYQKSSLYLKLLMEPRLISLERILQIKLSNLSAQMLLSYIRWNEASLCLIKLLGKLLMRKSYCRFFKSYGSNSIIDKRFCRSNH